MFVFLFTFASAHAWIITFQWLLTKHRRRYALLGVSFALTAVTFGGAYLFAYTSRDRHLRLPLDVSSILSNAGLDIKDKAAQEDAADAAALQAAAIQRIRARRGT